HRGRESPAARTCAVRTRDERALAQVRHESDARLRPACANLKGRFAILGTGKGDSNPSSADALSELRSEGATGTSYVSPRLFARSTICVFAFRYRVASPCTADAYHF